MLLADVCEQVVDVATDVRIRCLDARDDLAKLCLASISQDLSALTCGVTSSQVSTSTLVKPVAIAWLTSSWAPYLNHRVNRRRVSCNAFTFLSAIERKKPARFVSGITWMRHERTIDSLYNMHSQLVSWDVSSVIGLTLHEAHDVEVRQRPRVPSLVP